MEIKEEISKILKVIQDDMEYTKNWDTDDGELDGKTDEEVLEYLKYYLDHKTKALYDIGLEASTACAYIDIINSYDPRNLCKGNCQKCKYNGEIYHIGCFIKNIFRAYGDLPMYWDDGFFRNVLDSEGFNYTEQSYIKVTGKEDE